MNIKALIVAPLCVLSASLAAAAMFTAVGLRLGIDKTLALVDTSLLSVAAADAALVFVVSLVSTKADATFEEGCERVFVGFAAASLVVLGIVTSGVAIYEQTADWQFSLNIASKIRIPAAAMASAYCGIALAQYLRWLVVSPINEMARRSKKIT